MAQQMNNSILLEVPEGYTPQPFTPVQVRNLRDIRDDFKTDPEQWMDDLIDTVTEMNLPAEEVYQQEENLRMLQYRIDHAGNDTALKESLISGREELLDQYARYRVEADEKIEQTILEETKRRYLANLDIIVKDSYQPVEDEDLMEDALSEETLLLGYKPAPYEQKLLRSIEEQREVFETEPEGDEPPEPVSEEEWAQEMKDIISEEVMPASLLYGQEEMLRKIQYQIDQLNSNEDVLRMTEPYEIIEPDESMLSPEDYNRAIRDQLYKGELNRRFEKRTQLEKDRDDLLDIITEERFAWQKEVDERLDRELELRQENLQKREEFLREQRELAQEEAERLREETERQIRQAEIAKLIAKEERRREREEAERALEEEKRRAEEEQAERERRIAAYEENLRAEEEAKANRIFAERVRLRHEELRREEEEESYRAEQLARQKKNILSDALSEQAQEDGFFRAPERPEGEAGGTGLDEFLNEQQEGAVFMGDGDIDLSGAQSGSADDFFEQRPAEEEESEEIGEDIPVLNDLVEDAPTIDADGINLGRQRGTADDFFERRPVTVTQRLDEMATNALRADEISENLQGSEVPVTNAPGSDQIVRLPRTRVASAYRMSEEEFKDLKDRFVEAIGKQSFVYAGDRELLADLYDATYNKNHVSNKQLTNVLADIRDRKSRLNTPEDRRQTLAKIKESLDQVPEEERDEAYHKASDRVKKEIERVSFLEEADQFGKDVYDKGWIGDQNEFRDLYLAGEGLDKEHPFRKLMEDMRAGKSQSHPEFPATKVQRGHRIECGVIARLQTHDDLLKAKELLDKEDRTPAREQALRGIDRCVKQNREYAESQRKEMPDIRRWMALTPDQRTEFENLSKLLNSDVKARNVKNQLIISTCLSRLAMDPAQCRNFTDAKRRAEDIRALEKHMPEFIKGLTVDHPLFRRSVQVLGILQPELAEQVSKQAFETEMANMKVIKDNFAAVSKSYLGHKNSPEYQNMMNALDEALKSKTPQELIEKKKDLALMTTRYLDHTGLKSASIFHKNAETRRKLAFLTLYKCDSPERPWFESYQKSANQVRKKSDKILVRQLLNAPGIGKALPNQVKEINADALADKIGANQPVRETHQRKQTIATTEVKEMNAPTKGQFN